MPSTIDVVARHLVRPTRKTREAAATSLTLTAMSPGFCLVQFDVTVVNSTLSSIGHSPRGDVAELQ
jgi:DHA2 family methylenomycin A resistance protein-like MFS transporter